MQIQIHKMEVRILQGRGTNPAHILYKRSCRGIVSARKLIEISAGGIGYEEKGYSDPTDFEPFS